MAQEGVLSHVLSVLLGCLPLRADALKPGTSCPRQMLSFHGDIRGAILAEWLTVPGNKDRLSVCL